jgi:hypothetical protein
MTSIYVDFHCTTPAGTVRLNTIGSMEDLNSTGIVLKQGVEVRSYSEEFEVSGGVEFLKEEHIWVARYNGRNVERYPQKARPQEAALR